MMKYLLNLLKDFLTLSRNSKFLLLSVLISNIGNGIQLLTVGKVLYDKTNSVGAFGFVILSEQLIKFFLQLFSGSYVDSRNPRNVVVASDAIRGIMLLLLLLCFWSNDWIAIGLMVTTLAINAVKPFYNASIFALSSRIEEGDELLKLNIVFNTFFQVGQLLGSGIASIILMWFNPLWGVFINAVTFLISAFFLSCITNVEVEHGTERQKKKITLAFFLQDWKEFFKKLRYKLALVILVLLSVGDIFMVNVINLLMIPIINNKLSGHYNWLFFLDGGFAFGAGVFSLYVYKVKQKIGIYKTILLSVLIQAASFALISVTYSLIPMTILFILIGATNASSISLSITLTQQFSEKEIKGKISSLRQLVLSIFLLVSIPLIDKLHKINFDATLLLSSGILFLFFLGYFASKSVIFQSKKTGVIAG
ncbi:major facilitator superfamily MFS_1 [Thermoanaerobacter kivui]|uniref:Major facilitator superfamily MFS_1 n=1 Tax=Thermoanaerobacter kivui TaxID=2325 RepID=A0A097AQM5_THEKI|nr:MFS transporter [Thermoanaerobacter kivui]AIS52134.1 major facilitator superfamily MFS_1 [Thermoanaerobacter kivui]